MREELNRGYLDYLRPSAPAKPVRLRWWDGPVARRFLDSKMGRGIRALAAPVGNLARLVGLFLLSGVLLLYLSIANRRRREASGLHEAAVANIDLFLEQYPFHLYPLLCKTLELAFLQREIGQVASPGSSIAELAIGDGSLSRHIYPGGCSVVGLDISPFSLRSSARMKHVSEAVVADCLNPPLLTGSFDLLVSNNFLHHVTHKEAVLDHIARIARRAIFNENTVHWASSWPKPFVLTRLGFAATAARTTDRIARTFLQDLRSLPEIRRIVGERFVVSSEVCYLAANTYFLCGLFSRILGAYGPPTPAYLKRLAKRRLLGPAIRKTSRAVAKALLRYDVAQDLSTAAFVSYSCESRKAQSTGARSRLSCARCAEPLPEGLICGKCGFECPVIDGMIFNLPADLDFIREHYCSHVWDVYEPESLSEHQ